jgi:hypothetical protein
MCGRETLAMLVSSTSMNVASITVAAMSHGLTLGVQGTAGFAASGASATATRLAQLPSRLAQSRPTEMPCESVAAIPKLAASFKMVLMTISSPTRELIIM